MLEDHGRHHLPSPLDRFWAYWETRLVAGAPPIRNEDFSPTALRQWLGHLALIERDGSGGFRFRLAGTNLQSRFNAELTGKSFSQIDQATLGDLKDQVHQAMSRPCPVAKPVWSPNKSQKNF